MYHRELQRCFFIFNVIADKYKTQEHVFSWIFIIFLIVQCLYKYITQEMCDEDINDSLTALKLVPDWFVTSKMIKRRFTTLYTYKNILYFNKDSSNAVFNYNEMGIVNIDLHNMNLDTNFDEEDPNTIILIRFLI